jgi:hypothetical protein
VILGVDTARVSGWSVWSAGKWIAHGELDTLNASALRSVVADALEVGQAHALPCVLVLEKPYGGNVNVVAALGATRERWLAPWRELATGNVGKVVLVSPSTWRAAVLGGAWASAPREQVRPVEQAMAAGLVGCKPGMQLGGDEAAGVCIGWWGTRAGEVGRLLGKRAKAASIAAWRAP